MTRFNYIAFANKKETTFLQRTFRINNIIELRFSDRRSRLKKKLFVLDLVILISI